MMHWEIERKVYDYNEQEVKSVVETAKTWEEAVTDFNTCLSDPTCVGATVRSYYDGKPYPTSDPVVLDYRP